MCRILNGNTAEDDRNTHWKHTQSSPRFTAPGQSFAVKFVVIKHFACESFHVEPSCGLDFVVYMLKYMFC